MTDKWQFWPDWVIELFTLEPYPYWDLPINQMPAGDLLIFIFLIMLFTRSK